MPSMPFFTALKHYANGVIVFSIMGHLSTRLGQLATLYVPAAAVHGVVSDDGRRRRRRIAQLVLSIPVVR
jgi:hypothetical protein